MTTIETAKTILDDPQPAMPPDGCYLCEPGHPRDFSCRRCRTARDARQAALLALPEVAAILTHLTTLTPSDRRRLRVAYFEHFNLYRHGMSKIRHRVRRAYGQHWTDLVDIAGCIFRTAEASGCVADDLTGVACAAEDAVYAVVVGDLLTADERRLFTGPWDSLSEHTKETS
jgi:hypothetical protein